MAVVHLPVKFRADIFIQCGVIDILLKFKMAAAAILDLLGAATAMGPPTIFTRDSSLDVKSRKDVPYGGLNDVPLNFGGKTPQKLKFWGRE